ncbi:MAG: hypothetical protein AB1938_32150, partial [Myxococcota bacterium]
MSPVRLTLLAAFVFGFLVGCGGTSQRGACNATTCMSGCCDGNGECQPGFLESACGTGGLACFSCAAGLSCQFGVCVPGSSQGGGAGGSSGGGTGGGLGGGSGGGLGGGSGGGLGGGSGGGVGGGSGGGIGGGIGGGLGGGSGGGVG